MKYLWSILFIVMIAAGALAPHDRGGSAFDADIGCLNSDDAAVVQESVARLRRGGPDALKVLLASYDRHPDERLAASIDAVAGQRDAAWSRLYWYTDLEEARAAAAAQKKPILYLRLLGKLTDEYSCANSRFFRTVLYSNETVSRLLRERFVLVWGSERPVPTVTIDYGDGRTLKRTLTGNSIHYVLDPEGRVVDAFPGLFAPATFAGLVTEAADAAVPSSDARRREHVRRALASLGAAWQRDVASSGAGALAPPMAGARSDGPGAPSQRARAVAAAPDAAAAMKVAPTKSMGEGPLVRAAAPQFAAALDRPIGDADGALWRGIAAAHLKDAALDARSIALIRAQNPSAYMEPGVLDQTVAGFEKLIAEDTVHNNYELRRRLLAWLDAATTPMALEELNSRVYAELFLTPASDPWLGLRPPGAYLALTNDGCSAGAR